MISEMGTLYGAYLAFTLGCTFYALLALPPLFGWRTRFVLPLAAVIVVGLFWFQNTYRHQWSAEAYAMNQFEKMLILWETNKAEAMIRMDNMASSERPWAPYDDPYERDMFE